MIFAENSRDFQSNIQFIDTKWKAEDCQKAIKILFDEARTKFSGVKFQLYQDDAPIHVARSTIKFLKENEIDYVNAPSKLPDLSPIENWWTEISRAVYRDALSYNDRETLREAILREWPKLDAEKRKTVVMSVPNRLIKKNCKKRSVMYLFEDLISPVADDSFVPPILVLVPFTPSAIDSASDIRVTQSGTIYALSNQLVSYIHTIPLQAGNAKSPLVDLSNACISAFNKQLPLK
ncbi:MAG: hypothetical protein EZS28_006303 [Streblomastix strix]|uniref:Tc1-like transposase DDE domain-containing protein n=1 Tax=Streblomastix strix TaxID=222440 RepID=A0A5J4WVF5_9EUKA|nr:MAG: hypothetical protein EZS28_006303 [Streblomastix strix]